MLLMWVVGGVTRGLCCVTKKGVEEPEDDDDDDALVEILGWGVTRGGLDGRLLFLAFDK